tara:strand:+ start:2506 stop:2772 length:267 start_codon:yes stop_codon:yes gene_type:complete
LACTNIGSTRLPDVVVDFAITVVVDVIADLGCLQTNALAPTAILTKLKLTTDRPVLIAETSKFFIDFAITIVVDIIADLYARIRCAIG